jgi:hypothetical protein
MADSDPIQLAHLRFAAAVGNDLRGLIELASAPDDLVALGNEIERRSADDVRALLFAAVLVLDRPAVRAANGWTTE